MLRDYLRLGTLLPMPGGITPNRSGNYGYFALLQSVNMYCGGLTNIATTTANAVVLPQSAIGFSVIRLTAGANGGYTITLPTTSSIIGALSGGGDGITQDGSWGIPFSILNDNVGQQGTVTAGDASTTLTGTMTIATNTRRSFMLMVTSASTITIFNLGTQAI